LFLRLCTRSRKPIQVRKTTGHSQCQFVCGIIAVPI